MIEKALYEEFGITSESGTTGSTYFMLLSYGVPNDTQGEQKKSSFRLPNLYRDPNLGYRANKAINRLLLLSHQLNALYVNQYNYLIPTSFSTSTPSSGSLQRVNHTKYLKLAAI
jgi:hypothetical protein